MKHYDHVLAWVLEHPWAITPTHRQIIALALARKVAGEPVDPITLSAVAASRAGLPQPKRGGGLAIIPIHGVIAPRVNLLSDVSGGATFEALEQELAAALADPQVQTIVLDVNSPGGSVAGATEFARSVLKARAQKPVVAVAHHLMASAAYWVAACATEIVATPSAEVGSIGVFALYEDLSAALELLGIKRTVISAGKFKGEGVDEGPMSEAMRTHLQARVDLYYGKFVADVAAGRGVKADAVRRGYGEGRTLPAEEALAAGMVNRLGTLTDTLARLRPRASSVPAPMLPAAQALAPADDTPLPPDESGGCPEGYALETDGLCHLITTPMPATGQEPSPATPQEPSSAIWRNTFRGGLLTFDLHLLRG